MTASASTPRCGARRGSGWRRCASGWRSWAAAAPCDPPRTAARRSGSPRPRRREARGWTPGQGRCGDIRSAVIRAVCRRDRAAGVPRKLPDRQNGRAAPPRARPPQPMVRRLPNANAAAPTIGAAALCAAGWRGERRYGLGLGQVPQTGLELVPGTPPLRARLLPSWHELSSSDRCLAPLPQCRLRDPCLERHLPHRAVTWRSLPPNVR